MLSNVSILPGKIFQPDYGFDDIAYSMKSGTCAGPTAVYLESSNVPSPGTQTYKHLCTSRSHSLFMKNKVFELDVSHIYTRKKGVACKRGCQRAQVMRPARDVKRTIEIACFKIRGQLDHVTQGKPSREQETGQFRPVFMNARGEKCVNFPPALELARVLRKHHSPPDIATTKTANR